MDDNASETGQTVGSGSTVRSPGWGDDCEALLEEQKEKARTWMREYKRLDDAARAATPPSTPPAGSTEDPEDLKVEFFGRGMPLPLE